MEKICFVMANYFKYFKGGAELQAYLLAKELSKEIEVHYLFMKHPNFSKIKFNKVDDGIILYPMNQYVYRKFGKFFFMNYWELLKKIREIDPDLIYQRGGKPYIGMTSNWCEKNNKKSVLGISMESNCYKSGILNFKKNIASYPSNIINGAFTFRGLKKADLIISQSKRQKELLNNNFNLDSTIIKNGLPFPKTISKKARPPIISWIANIKTLKQPEVFIKLAEKCEKLNVRFVYAGRPSHDSYQNMLLKKTGKLPNLKYLGELSLKETNELLSESSLLINTSITEGFSNTYIQAWMRETPVVTLNCDPDDIIKHNKIGFHSGSFKQLVNDVIYLIENEVIRANMGKKAREYALGNHDIKIISKNYLEIFRKLVN